MGIFSKGDAGENDASTDPETAATVPPEATVAPEEATVAPEEVTTAPEEATTASEDGADQPAPPSGFVRDILSSAVETEQPAARAEVPLAPTAAVELEPPMAPWDPRSVDLYTHPHGEEEPDPAPEPSVVVPTEEFVNSLAIENGMGASAVGRPRRIGAFGIAVMVLAVAIIGFGTYIFLRKITDNFSIFGDDTVRAVAGEVGAPAEMTYSGHELEVTVSEPISQPSASWASFLKPSSGRYLLLSVSVKRTDEEAGSAQVAYYDWKFTGSDGQTVAGIDQAGGYTPLLSTLDLKPDASKSGLIAFDTDATDGTLSLTSPLGKWGTWPVTATKLGPSEGVLGEGLLPQAGSPPFSVTVANPRWLPADDTSVAIPPNSGSFLVLDLVAAVDPSRVAPGAALYVSDRNFQFVAASGQPVPANSGRLIGGNPITFGAKAGQIGKTVIAFDVAPGAGTLQFLNADGSVLAQWSIPGA